VSIVNEAPGPLALARSGWDICQDLLALLIESLIDNKHKNNYFALKTFKLILYSCKVQILSFLFGHLKKNLKKTYVSYQY
jgi:hypothetical protein